MSTPTVTLLNVGNRTSVIIISGDFTHPLEMTFRYEGEEAILGLDGQDVQDSLKFAPPRRQSGPL